MQSVSLLTGLNEAIPKGRIKKMLDPLAESNKVPLKAGRTGKLFENSLEKWLTTKEAAEYLRVSVGRLRNMTSWGQVPYYKLGKSNRYRLHDLRELLFKTKKGDSYGN